MKASQILLSAMTALLFVSGCTLAQNAAVKKSDGMLVNAAGMTLYTFDKDAAGSGKSACNGPCATLWPPIPATDAQPAAPYSIVTRDDGTKQLAYNGKPLYLYALDKQPGDRSGDNVKNVWHVAKE